MACRYCEIAKGQRKAAKIYEDYLMVAFLPDEPIALGHVTVIPKKHHVIFEEMDEVDAAYFFRVVNKLSIVLFETLKIEGTNILVKNGVEAGQEEPHFSVDIISRTSNDGIALEWVPKQLSHDQMATVEVKLKEEIAGPQRGLHKVTPPDDTQRTEIKEVQKDDTPDTKTSETAIETPRDTEESYLIRQLRRIP